MSSIAPSPRWLLVVVGLFAAFACGKRQAAPGNVRDVAAIDRGRIVARVSASGTLSALVTVQVGSQVSGRIQEIFVDFNAPVKKGQPIARIDPQLFVAAVEQARANLMAAEGTLAKAEINAAEAERQYQRTKGLAAAKLISAAELDAAEATAAGAKAELGVARGNLAQARAALNHAQVNLTYTTIVSPIDGVVISRAVDVGQTVAASFQAPTLFVLAEDLKKMEVHTNVAEADVGKLSAGMNVTFTVDAFASERFAGTLRQIRNAAQTVQNVVTYDAVIDVANDDLRLRPGMTANVTFIWAERDDVLRVPNLALRFKPSEAFVSRNGGRVDLGSATPPAADARTVWRATRGGAEPVELRIGVSDGSYTEVVSGALSEGEELVVEETGDGAGASAAGSKGTRPPMRIF